MANDSQSLRDLRADFLRTSTPSMPVAGLIAWSGLGLVALTVSARISGTLALYIMAMILPLAFLLERLRGRALFAGGTSNPLVQLFLASIAGIGVTVPLVILGARAAHEPALVVLGMAILTGVIWIPYGWAADDAVGLRHALARAVGCYAAFALAPAPYRITAICGVVALAYLYSIARMKRPPNVALTT
ncbi:DUF7010 family protein [Gemmatimonas groenlandica]|uniref:Uncharacterized protein n=1 Tax=Gemmatimonas groenlandica TaxID=2732249 RepID=A0A6M4ITG9_9BACT|nr:hypothetical protein [Gemmatimonas groenlandica]QJR37515.1 hypothetical protein HKW67_19350 [Gemmatimonas groenlandica]